MNLEINKIDNQNHEDDELSLKEIIHKINELIIFLKIKKIKIFFVIFIGAVIGLAFAISQKPKYTAILTFAMEDDKGGANGGGLSSALGLASSFGIDLGGGGGGGAFAASNLSELMKSRLLVEKVLLKPMTINGKTTSLAEYFIKINELRKGWGAISALKKFEFISNESQSKFTVEQDSILKQIHGYLTDKDRLSIIQKDKKITILTIEVTNENEFFAKTFCENIAKETSDFYILTKNKKSRLNVEVLNKQVDSIRNKLDYAITGVAYEADNVYNLNPSFKVKEVGAKKQQIDVQSNSVVLTNLIVQLELAKITLRKETPLIQLIDQPKFPLEKNKISKLKSLISGGFISGILIILYYVAILELKKKLA